MIIGNPEAIKKPSLWDEGFWGFSRIENLLFWARSVEYF
jgi:hypothetical protein